MKRLATGDQDPAVITIVDDSPVDRRHKASWARLIQKVYEVDPLECTHCGATLRIVALIDDAGVIERILKHLSVRDPQPETPSAPQGTCSFRLHTRIQRPLFIPGASPTR